jgi:2-desacetyl-2-hydroxyethyl bacteriochlorophyllide A dehydrogenase
MRAVVCETPGTLALTERPWPTRNADEALIQIRRVGICGTDYHIFRGNQPYLAYPRVMGHELAAEVIDAPEEAALTVGAQVCVIPYLSCGHCRACRRGRENCCANLQVLGVHRDGGLTERLSVPVSSLVDATGLTLDQAAMVEFLAIGHHAVARADMRAADRVLVVGAGPIGMATCLFAARTGAEVTVLDGNAARANLCVAELGAAAAVILGDGADEELAALSADEGFDIVFDATGSPLAMDAGFARVAHGGTYVLVSVVSAVLSVDDPAFHKREMTLKGSRNATRADFVSVIAAMRAGAVPMDAMHTHGAALDDLPDRFTEWMDPANGVIKAIVTV